MAKIVVNEISQNYTYNVGTNSFCTVGLPITACWGPAYEDPDTVGVDKSTMLENTTWRHFRANQDGLEEFVSTYRGPAANYRSAGDYSYQMAMTLLTSGYDIDVCRLCPGSHAQGTINTDDLTNPGSITFIAKHPGSFGNNLKVTLNKVVNKDYWNLVVRIVDTTGIETAVENILFVFDIDHSTDSILHISEVVSDFVSITVSGLVTDSSTFAASSVMLGSQPGTAGSDRAADTTASAMMSDAIALATARYGSASGDYVTALSTVAASGVDIATASKLKYMEWVYNSAVDVYPLLKDKLSYTTNRIISPWDDQNITAIDGSVVQFLADISPIHLAIMDASIGSRCATGFIDIPKCLPRSAVYNESPDPAKEGYAQKLSRRNVSAVTNTIPSTHYALWAPWGKYTYVGTSKQNPAPPSFLALLIQRSMILNQSLQYEWIMPTNRKHNVAIGKLDYTVPKQILDVWQKSDGVGVNIITYIPDLGTCIWGNSTLYEVPPATYQALANLSTRFLMNAIEDVVYRVGTSITFQYNNKDAYSKFYAGVTPLLDTMESVGAIVKGDDTKAYVVKMAPDINGLDSVNANSVIGKIYIKVAGVINDITVDLVALPQSANLDQY